jgi:hypothetical protein
MSDDPVAALVDKCRKLDAEENLAVYAHLLGDEELKHEAAIPARALRDKARAGDLDAPYVPLLTIALVDAPNYTAFIHLAKALAAFGRQAEKAASYVVERLEAVQVTNDRRFWVLDSGLWVLGYLGGDVARSFVAALKAEKPSRVMRSRSVYEGALKDEQREEMFARTLDEVLALIDGDDPGTWRDKKTELGVAVQEDAPKKLSPWMTR